MTPVYLQAVVEYPWLNTTNAPAKPKDTAWISANLVDRPGERVLVHFNPTNAAALGRRLLDWANLADPGAALAAVGTVTREAGR